jgi:DNA polymerase-1
MELKRLFLLDAMALIYRAYYALNKNPRITSSGLNTSAILGFTNSLYDVLKNEKPSHIGVVFDSHAPTLRVADFAEYKANRQATPDDILTAIPYIKKIITGFGIPILELDGYEADDIIGTIAHKAANHGFEVLMMTPDKDFGQLLTDKVHIYKPAKMGEKAQIVKTADFCAKYEIKNPTQFIDILGLWGDAVDNIPGIPGVGEVTAKKLVAQFDSIENMIANADQIANEKLRIKVKENADKALLSKKLATIILDVPLDFEEDKLKYENLNLNLLKNIFDELEFRTFAKRIFTDFSIAPPPASAGKQAAQMFSDGEFDLFSDLSDENAYTEANIFKKYSKENCQYILVRNNEELEKLLTELNKQELFSFQLAGVGQHFIDTEPVGIAFASNTNAAFYVPLMNNTTFVTLISDFFSQSKTPKTCFDLKTNCHFLNRLNIPLPQNCHDIMLAHYVLQAESRHHFEYLSQTYLKHEPINIQELTDSKKHSAVQLNTSLLDSFKNALCEKADLTLQLHQAIMKQMENSDYYKLYSEVEIPLTYVLCQMESNGVTIDKASLKEISTNLQKEIEILQQDIHQLAGEVFNIASPKQLGDILFEKLLPDVKAKKTKTKQYQTGEDILVKLKDKHPIIEKILEYRSITKLKSTYVDPLPQLINPLTKRIHATFNQAVTATGRLSSTNPNLQNLPIRSERGKEIRKAIIPSDDNFEIMSADYSQIELRIIASLSGDQNMCEAFDLGMDIHRATAAKVFGKTLEEVDSDMRRKAKAVNFGIIYGISSFGLAEQLNISRKEASELISAYFEKYPDIKKYMDAQIEFAKTHGYVETMMKRRRYLPDINSSNSIVRNFAERNAVNAPIQGSAADMIKMAMVKVFEKMQEQKLKSKLLIQVHDELVFEAHVAEIEQLKTLIVKEMQDALTLKVPIEVQIENGKNWLEAH